MSFFNSAKIAIIAMVLFVLAISGYALNWATGGEPRLLHSEGQWTISFAVTESTDVEISIVRLSDSSVIRHLAAGMLGSNPPSPLLPNTLSQTVIWDGLDDYRRPVTDTALSVRVRAGMSTHMDNVAGAHPDGLTNPRDITEGCGYGESYLTGLDQADDGTVTVLSKPAGNGQTILRSFTAKGDYVRTVFPISGSQSSASASLWGSIEYGNGQWSPFYSSLFKGGPFPTNSPLAYDWSDPTPVLLPVHDQNHLAVLDMGGSRPGVTAMPFYSYVINRDGTRDADCQAASIKLIASPALPAVNSWGGPLYVATTPDRSAFFFSGFFGLEKPYGYVPGTLADCITAADTGFYQDGRLFKVDMATRTASVFFSLDTQVVKPGPERVTVLGNLNRASLHGVAVDDSGRVFVADMLHNRIIVLDNTGDILRTFPCPEPDAIALSRETGALYVSRLQNSLGYGQSTGYFSIAGYIYKFANWRTDTAATAAVTLPKVYSYYISAGNYRNRHSFLTACETDEGTLLWFATLPYGVKIYKDQGNNLAVYKDFQKSNPNDLLAVYRLEADPKTENVFISKATGMYKVTDWSAPRIVVCSTATKQPLTGYDVGIDPKGRYLYTHGPLGYLALRKGIYRYSLDGQYHSPMPLPGRADNRVTDSVEVRQGGVDIAEHGIAVAPNGTLLFEDRDNTQSGYHMYLRHFADTGSPAVILSQTILSLGDGPQTSGLRFDLAGNFYIGKSPVSPDVDVPDNVKNYAAYKSSAVSIARYKATGSLDSLFFLPSEPVVDKVYNVDFGVVGEGFSDGCTCTAAQFGMDNFGRLYVPNAVLQKVSIVDNNGNRILRIGNHGNLDDLRAELAGQTNSVGRCTMAYPMDAVSTDDYVYVSDMGNMALLRIKKDFVLDNIPGLTDHASSEAPVVAAGEPEMEAYPNPFNPSGYIRVSLPAAGDVQLAVFDLKGQCIKQLAKGSMVRGDHRFVWNGTNAAGAKAAAGMYIYRLRVGHTVLKTKVVLAK